MKISAKAEYALRAVTYLASRYGEGCVPIHDIARAKNIPLKFLEQILLQLKASGYAESKRGAKGGYNLAKDPKDITLAEIVRLMEISLAPVRCIPQGGLPEQPCGCERVDTCDLGWVWRDIYTYTASLLENVTFRDVCEHKVKSQGCPAGKPLLNTSWERRAMCSRR